MNELTTAMKLSLCALGLGTGVAAQAAAPVIINITMVGATPQFAVQSDLGVTNQIQYCTDLSQTNWVVLTNLTVVQSPYWFVDVAAPPASQRFYRVAALAVSTPPPFGVALIPAGSFTMGDTLDGESDAIPMDVYVSAFYMDTNLVSYSQWQMVYNWATSQGYGFGHGGSGMGANHPVQTVDWYDVVKWSNARSQQAGLTPVYYTDAGLTQVYTSGETDGVYPNWAASGYRLPTEAEWEKAARGGLSGQRFPWGNTISESQANYYGATNDFSYDLGPSGFNAAFGDSTSPVGYFAPNGYGIYDMAGNVNEWCWDWYGTPYGQPTTTNPTGGPAGTGYRVLRGGSWDGYAYGARCASRYNGHPYYAYVGGFRCVRGS